jgi:hypothetical protein
MSHNVVWPWAFLLLPQTTKQDMKINEEKIILLYFNLPTRTKMKKPGYFLNLTN